MRNQQLLLLRITCNNEMLFSCFFQDSLCLNRLMMTNIDVNYLVFIQFRVRFLGYVDGFFCHQSWKIFRHYFFKYFLSFSFCSWDFPYVFVDMFDGIHIFLRPCLFFFIFIISFLKLGNLSESIFKPAVSLVTLFILVIVLLSSRICIWFF